MTPALATDLASSLIGALGCFAVVWWMERTPGRSFLERRSVGLLMSLGLVFMLRVWGWQSSATSFARWLAYWPATLHPLMMALFVEGLLRRHLPLWLKGSAVGLTLAFILLHLVPSLLPEPASGLSWPVGMTVIMGMFAWQMWRMRNAGLSREERRMLAGVIVVAVVAIPMVFTDSGLLLEVLPIRVGPIGGLLFVRVLLTPPAADGFRDTLAGLARLALRSMIVAGVMTFVLFELTTALFVEVFTLALCLQLLFEVLDRLRRRQRSELEAGLFHWLAAAPRENFAEWRRALRHAPLMGDAVILDGEALARYDEPVLRAAFERHGALLSEPDVRALAARAGDDAESIEQVLDVLTSHALSHVGLLGTQPLRLIGVNVPQVAAPDVNVRLRVIIRTGQDLLKREGAAAV